MVIAAAAVLAGVIVVALGRGGELTFFQADYAPIKLDQISATDVVLFRPPMALWGYNAQATDEALNRIADALTERDIEIAALRQQVADLEADSPAARRRDPGPPDRAQAAQQPPAGPPAQHRDGPPAQHPDRPPAQHPDRPTAQHPDGPRVQHSDGTDTAPPRKPAAEADGW